ncbi:DUF2634 domain-containing protein [Bacillus tianshenii]|nr:DUF2634 domain-containing protein [Bacillus tianshenii]
MKWNPATPVKSNLNPRLDVHSYKSDLAFDFDNGDLIIANGDLKTVSGLENFIQKVKKVLLTQKTATIDYGLNDFLPDTTNENRFKNDCQLLANELVSHEFSDSTPNDPNGLGYSIESVVSIEYLKVENTLSIKMQVTGEDNLQTIGIKCFD